MYIAIASEIWMDLCERFHQSNVPRIFQLHKQLNAQQQKAFDINIYCTQFKVLWEELKNFQLVPTCHCGGMQAWVEYQQQEHVIQFLIGLNDSYFHTRSQILIMKPIKPLARFSHLFFKRRDNDLSIKVSLLYWSPQLGEIQVKPLQILILVALLLNPSVNDLNVPIVGFKGTLWIAVTSFMGTYLATSPSQRVNWAKPPTCHRQD